MGTIYQWKLTLTFIYTLSIYPPTCGSDTWTTSSQSTRFRVYDYRSYRDVIPMSFEVPRQAFDSSWTFVGYEDSGCDTRTIHVFLQNGGYPVINPLNESFPPDFALKRNWLLEVTLPTNRTEVTLTLTSPLPGTWMAVAFLERVEEDERIMQQGLGSQSCGYSMTAGHSATAYSSIEELMVNRNYTITLGQGNGEYRFSTSDTIWEYSVVLRNCVYHADDSPAGNTVTCPVVVYARGNALPNDDVSSKQTDCREIQEDEECVLVYPQPETNTWHYLQLQHSTSGLGTIEFQLIILTKECSKTESGPRAAGILPARYDDVVTGFSTAQEHPESLSDVVHMEANRDDDVVMGFATAQEHSDSFSDLMRMEGPDILTTALLENLTLSRGIQNVMQQNKDSPPNCVQEPELHRRPYLLSNFRVEFRRAGSWDYLVLVPVHMPLVMKFSLWPNEDMGGTLKFLVSLPLNGLNNTARDIKLEACILREKIPVAPPSVSCPDEQLLVATSESTDSAAARVYFPYPESGNWYVAMVTSCYRTMDNGTTSPVDCVEPHFAVSFEVSTDSCVESGCGENGYCDWRRYRSYVYSVCICVAKWRGYGCTDGTVADSKAVQMTAALLLTLSNLMFIPAILLAVYRKYYNEALVYSYTMFFSTFYHACDGDRKYKYCMLDFGVLQFCDFLGAIMSFWVTLMAMSRLTRPQRSFMHVLGALGVAVGVSWNKHSLWTFIVPIGGAAVITLSTWFFQCYHRRQCYPSRKRWLLYLVPGLLIAGAGLIVFAFFETEGNYRFTHSVWHACCATTILFLLPPNRHKNSVSFSKEKLEEDDNSSFSIAQDHTAPSTGGQADNWAFVLDQDGVLPL